ncbi:MAG: hypothetical protein HND52_17765 [Ignavibacteriae bacterium]|nr:hypothetical protein [Ignavibacteriota bacterium]
MAEIYESLKVMQALIPFAKILYIQDFNPNYALELNLECMIKIGIKIAPSFLPVRQAGMAVIELKNI